MKLLDAQQLEIFCQRLSSLLAVGIHAEEAVSLLAEETSLPSEILDKVTAALSEGQTLSQSLTAAGGFEHDMIEMVTIGERSGRLEQVLGYLATYYNRQKETRWALRRAVGYPALMAGLIIAVFALVITQVLPIFARVFTQVGAGLPAGVAQLVELGSAGRVVIYIVALALVVLTLLLFWKTERTNKPPVGKVARQALERSRFSSAFALLLSSGVPLDESLKMTIRFMTGSELCPQIEAAAGDFATGESLAKALGDRGVLTRSEASQLAVGMRGGNSEEMMSDVSVRCAEEADRALQSTLSRFEFGLILALCLLVALILLTVILPLLGVLTAIS